MPASISDQQATTKPPTLRLEWATHESASWACKRWHYSRCTPSPPLVKIGVWEDGAFIGVVLFSRGAAPRLLSRYGLTQTQGCELTRIALTTHRSSVTRIVRLALGMLSKATPSLRLVVSFADPAQGHVGAIYQAGNWIYTGTSDASKTFYYGGKKLHRRQVSASGYSNQHNKFVPTPLMKDCVAVDVPGKHRYLMPLDSEMRARIISLASAYPKRAKAAGIEVSTPIWTEQHRSARSTEPSAA